MKGPAFVVRGGVRAGASRLGAVNASWPFAQLRADESTLVVTCFGNRWVFPKSSIARLGRHRGFFSTGLRIEHNVEAVAVFFVFWCFRFAALQRELEQRGYRLSTLPR